MRRKSILLFIVLIALSLLIASCDAETAEQIQEAVEEAAPTIEAAVEEAAPTIEAAATEVSEAMEEEEEEMATGETVVPETGLAADMVLMPKFLGILVFDQANEGAQEAHGELGNPNELQFLGPTPENSVAGQIDILTTATTQGVNAIMISNNAGDQIAPAPVDAVESGMTVVTWDSPIPSAEGEQFFIAQVDFDETGVVMADMALSILGRRWWPIRHPFGIA